MDIFQTITKKTSLKWWLWLIAITFVVFVSGCSNQQTENETRDTQQSQKSDTTTQNETEKDSKQLKDKYIVGEIATLGNVKIQVADVLKSNGSDFDKPKEGNEFVIVKVLIKNTGDRKISYNSFDFKMKNSNGQITDRGLITIDSDTSLSSGELSAGGLISGTLAFEQPKDDNALTLLYEPNYFSDKKISVNLMKSLNDFDILKSETINDSTKNILNIGEVATLGKTQVQVVEIAKSNGTDFDKPKKGNEFVIVKVIIKNSGDSDIDYNSYDFKMKNSKGRISDTGIIILDSDTALDSGELSPGGLVSGTLAFEQPKDDDKLTLIYEPNYFSDKQVTFDLMQSLEDFDVLTSETTNNSSDGMFKIGDISTLGKTQVQVIQITKSNGSDFDKPKKGNEFVIVKVIIKNTGDTEIDYNSYDFKMKNSNGQITDTGLTTINSDTALDSGELSPGGLISGTLAFEQPKDDDKLTLIYEPNYFSDKQVTFNLMQSLDDFDVLTSKKTNNTSDDMFKIGDTATLGQAQVQVVEMKKSNGSDFDEPKKGNEFVIVKVLIKNTGDAEIDYNSYDFKMKNSQGQISDTGLITIDSDTALNSGSLAPGGLITGTLAFEQPKDDTALTLIYEPDSFSDKRIFINLMESVGNFEMLKPEVADIQSDKIFKTGDLAKLDDIQVKVVETRTSNGSDFDQPKDGYVYVIIKIQIKNTGNNEISYNPYSFKMQNSQGQISDTVFTSIDSDTALSSGKLDAGGKITGTLAFEQPKGDKNLILIYEKSSLSDKRLVFSLSN